MNPIAEIQSLLEQPLRQVRQIYIHQLQSNVPLLNEVNHYLLQHNGKMIRPMLVLLGAATRDEALLHDDKTLQLAAAMEMLHNSTLIHDDVVDGDLMRRGQPSVNSKWNNRIAVLVGDFYLAQVMNIMHRAGDKAIAELLNQTVVKMCEGEMLQQQHLSDPLTNPDTYRGIIYRKTAALMETSCAVGNPILQQFGTHFGMAFQLRDDLNDHESLPCTEAMLRTELAAAHQCLDALPPSVYKESLQKLTNTLS